MEQVHRRLTSEHVRALLKAYCEGSLDRPTIQDALGLRKSQFFAVLKAYRQDPERFSIDYQRRSPSRIPTLVEAAIERELLLEKGLIDDPELPITTYNYSAVRDRLDKRGIHVSLPTIIERAKRLGCYRPQKQRQAHDREVLTTAIGALIQHDASHHRWSPYAREKWVLITSLDDFSRRLLFADFFEQESTWVHITAAEALTRTYGLPLRYYVDSLRVFRFVQQRDSVWRKHVLQTDDAEPQWRQVMRTLGVDVAFALSPQAKGKIERPYRWLQDRIVRTCAIEKLTTIDEARAVLQEEVTRYNDRQVHSTTGEIPSLRFERARQEGKTLFRPFVVPKPYTSPKDVFCLRQTRRIDGYRRISLFGHTIEVPGVPLRKDIEIHLVPDLTRGVLTVRIWWEDKLKRSLDYPLHEFPQVQF